MRHSRFSILTALALASLAHAQAPAGNAFTYQGRLTENGQPASGVYDLSFRLYPGASSIFPVGNVVALEDVQVTGGLFTVKLDFGDQFDGKERWLSINVRPGASTGSYTSLSPRQALTPAPYAMNAASLGLPLVQSGYSDAGLISSGLIHIMQGGSDNAIYGQTSGTGAAVMANATASGAGVHAISTNGRAGWFEITNNASPQIALFGATSGTGIAIEGYTTGTGKAIAGYNNGAQGNAGYFRNGNAANTHEALYAETVGNGPAILAKASGLGAALQIADGYIKVDGAGVGATTPVFIHVTSNSNINGNWSYINHPLTNGDPNAILIVTANRQVTGYTHSVVSVQYDPAAFKWALRGWDGDGNSWDFGADLGYNILVFKP